MIESAVVKFEYGNSEIECKVEWSSDGKELSVNFFNPNTGYTGSSDPASVMNGWSYQESSDNDEIWLLIDAVRNLYDWTDKLSWEDGEVETFQFQMIDGELELN